MTTRTYGPIHFGDLDPNRFEMMVMEIVYRMRRSWERIDYTGAAGSDDGVDISAIEILENEKKNIHHFQCKRYDKLSKSKLVEIVKDYINKNPRPADYYYIVCGCNPSKNAIDGFNEVCEKSGIKHCSIWSASFLETLLYSEYPDILYAFFGIDLFASQKQDDSHQIFDIEKFVKVYDKNGTNAPIDTEFCFRDAELNKLIQSIKSYNITIISGASGIGKTRIALEACRRYEAEGWKVYCVRSNEQLLYDDIKYYLRNDDNYLLFFDDANNVIGLQSVLALINSMNIDGEVRILMTVRDYVRNKVINAVQENHRYNEITIGIFKREEIQSILKNNYNIQNYDYLKRICDVSKGNIRLAVLAAIRAIDSGYPAITNAEDIFRYYYDPIINKCNLRQDEITLLCIIALSGAVRNKSNRLYQSLKVKYLGQGDETAILEKLNEYELIDWFKSEVIKIADQSFGNYVLYYVLYVKRWIDIEDLILLYFPDYKSRITEAISTLYSLFQSNEMIGFLNQSINNAWEKSDSKDYRAYVINFYPINPLKALIYLKEYVDNQNAVDFDLQSYDLKSQLSYHVIRTEEIKILASYYITDEYETAVEILLNLYEKRPDLVVDFYFAIRDSIYTRYSKFNKLNTEEVLNDKLWLRCKDGDDYKFTYLYIHTMGKVLETEVSYTDYSEGRSLTFVRFNLPATNEVMQFRCKVINRLCSLYNDPRYHDDIHKVLLGIHYFEINKKNTQELWENDLQSLYEYFKNKSDFGFEDALILHNYRHVKTIAEGTEQAEDDRLRILDGCYEYTVYALLTREHIIGRSVEEDEKEQIEEIAQAISSYTLLDYQHMFEACEKIEKLCESKTWNLSTGISSVFALLENDSRYTSVVESYFKVGAPTYVYQFRMMRHLIAVNGYFGTRRLIEEVSGESKDGLMRLLWEQLEEEQITEVVADDFNSFQENQLKLESPEILNIRHAYKYLKYDQRVIYPLSEYLIQAPNRIGPFFGYTVDENAIAKIECIYRSRMDLLQKMYFACDSSHFDYGGMLFRLLFKYDPEDTWCQYIQKVKSSTNDHGDDGIFRWIWEEQYTFNRIDYAYNELIQNAIIVSNESARILFDAKKEDKEDIRKKKWLFEKIERSITDIRIVSDLIGMVDAIYPKWKNELILHFLSMDKSIDSFKQLDLFSRIQFSIGSEIPLIISQIDSLESLKSVITGADYIEHKIYLQEIIDKMKKHKEEVEIQEYQENEIG